MTTPQVDPLIVRDYAQSRVLETELKKAEAVLVKEHIKPLKDKRKKLATQIADDRKVLLDSLTPGDRWEDDEYVVTLSSPTKKFVEEVAVDKLVDYIRQESPALLAAFIAMVDATPAAALTVKKK